MRLRHDQHFGRLLAGHESGASRLRLRLTHPVRTLVPSTVVQRYTFNGVRPHEHLRERSHASHSRSICSILEASGRGAPVLILSV